MTAADRDPAGTRTVRIGPLVVEAASVFPEAVAYLDSTFVRGAWGSDDALRGPGFAPVLVRVREPHTPATSPVEHGVRLVRRGYDRRPAQVVAAIAADHVDTVVPATPHACRYELRRRGMDIEIVSSEGFRRRSILTSVARDVWRRTVENIGGTVLHAATVQRGPGAWLFVGRKGAGKTSTALSLAAAGAGALVENDRTAVVPAASCQLALPVPLTVRVGRGTLTGLGWGESVESLQSRLFSAASATPSRAATAKINFSRGELARELGVPLSKGAPIAGVVLPELDPRLSRPELGEVTTAELRAVLRRFTYLPADPGLPDDWLLLRRRSEREIRENAWRICDEICRLPAIRFRSPGASPHHAQTLADALDGLTERTTA